MFTMILRKLGVALLAVALIGLLGCVTPDAGKRIAAFSNATTLTTQNVTSAFDMVERNYYQMQVAKIVNKYDAEGFNPNSIQRFLEPEELDARITVLKGLQQYSEKLSVIMGNSQLSEFDKQTKNLGDYLTAMNSSFVKQKILNKAPATDSEIQTFTTAVNALGHWFVEYKRQTSVKEIVNTMHPHVERICELLKKDIGFSPFDGTPDARGLRGQLWNQYKEAMTAQDQFIIHSKALDPITKREEIRKLAQLVPDQMQADIVLKSMQSALGTLTKTHSKLKDAFAKNAIELENLISQLFAEGQRIKDFYQGLSKQ
jgi:hypothetical protein